MKYYSVTAKCGHVGKNYYIPIEFSVAAESAKDAADLIRNAPRVKHHHKDAILAVREIDFQEYSILEENNRYDPYLRCQNKQQQKAEMDAIRLRICEEYKEENDRNRKSEPEGRQFFAGKNRVRNVRRFMKEQTGFVRLSTARNAA